MVNLPGVNCPLNKLSDLECKKLLVYNESYPYPEVGGQIAIQTPLNAKFLQPKRPQPIFFR